MAHSPKDALLAAKQDLLAAYSSVHSSLGRLISLVHSSEPHLIADVLGSEFERHSQSSPSQDYQYSRGSTGQPNTTAPVNTHPNPTPTTTPFGGSRPIQQQYHEPHPFSHSNTPSHYPLSSQPNPNPPRTHPPPGPSFVTVSHPSRQQAIGHAPLPKPRQHNNNNNHPQPHHSYGSQPVQPLETDEEEDEEDYAEDPMSEDDHMATGPHSTFYDPPRQPVTIPTPPGSIPGGKKKRAKRERDPNAPKRPASAYILFQNAVRREMRAANPTADYKELARQIGDRWKNLSEEAKRPWSEAGKLAMTSWNIQNKEYKTSHPEATSPHHQSNHSAGGSLPAPRKKRSQATEVDDHGHAMRKKRGRPSKAETHTVTDHHEYPPQPGLLQPTSGSQALTANGRPITSTPQVISPSIHNLTNQTPALSQAPAEESSDEEEDDEEEEEEEEEEDSQATDSKHPPCSQPPARTSLPQAAQMNGTSQPTAPNAPTDSELEEGEEDESGLAAHNHHVSNKLGVQSNAIMA